MLHAGIHRCCVAHLRVHVGYTKQVLGDVMLQRDVCGSPRLELAFLICFGILEIFLVFFTNDPKCCFSFCGDAGLRSLRNVTGVLNGDVFTLGK